MQGRQAQHREAQVKARQRVGLAKGNGQQTRQPEAPTTGAGRGRAGQGRRQADPQGAVGPPQQTGKQDHRQAENQCWRQIRQDREAGDDLTAKGIQDQAPGLQEEIAQAHHQQQEQAGQDRHQRTAGEGRQGAFPQLLARGLLPQAPTTAQLLQLERQAQPQDQGKGQALKQPAAQHHREGIELRKPLRLDHQARQKHQQTQHQGSTGQPAQQPLEALNRYLHKPSRSLAETRQHNRPVKPPRGISRQTWRYPILRVGFKPAGELALLISSQRSGSELDRNPFPLQRWADLHRTALQGMRPGL